MNSLFSILTITCCSLAVARGAVITVNEEALVNTSPLSVSSAFEYTAPISTGPVTITVGNTVMLNFTFGEGRSFRWATHANPESSDKFRISAGLFDLSSESSLGAHTLTSRSVTFLDNSGDFAQNPLIGEPIARLGSATSSVISSTFFADRRFDANDPIIFDGEQTFSEIQVSFDLEEFSEMSRTFDHISLSISVSQGFAGIVPEPRVFALLSLTSILSCKRNRAS